MRKRIYLFEKSLSNYALHESKCEIHKDFTWKDWATYPRYKFYQTDTGNNFFRFLYSINILGNIVSYHHVKRVVSSKCCHLTKPTCGFFPLSSKWSYNTILRVKQKLNNKRKPTHSLSSSKCPIFLQVFNAIPSTQQK